MDSLAAASREIDRTAEIDGLSIRVYFWSRNPLVLAGVAAVILGIGLGIGRWLEAAPGESMETPVQLLRAELQQPQPDSGKVFEQLGETSGALELLLMESAAGVQSWIQKSKLSAADKSVAVAYCESRNSYGDEPSADLLWYAHQRRPLSHSNELIGDLHASAKKLDEAISYYEREAASPTAATARGKLIDLYLEKKNFAAADHLLATPLYEQQRTPMRTITLATAAHRWGDLLRPILELEKDLFQPAPMLLAAVAGLVWINVSLQAIQPARLVCFRTVVPLLAIAMGMVSTFPTLLASEWQGEMWGLTEGKGVIGDVLYFVAGVGVREEVMKLLCFVPFIPVLLARGSRLEMLMIAGFVGLGFAIEENLQYFKEYGALAAFVRFLTANFFHLALTGTIGLSLCEAILTPRRWWVFPVTFIVMVLAHGFYDVLASAGGISVFRLMVNLIFVLVSLYFFRRLRPLRDPATDQLNIAATLVAGLAILLSYIFVCAAREAGFVAAVALLLVEFVGLCMVCYMFYWQLGEALSGEKEQLRPSYYG
ncbi:MAG: PrsW family glutamic-type intramembrane protease [Chthoniobacteraceae bacterium]